MKNNKTIAKVAIERNVEAFFFTPDSFKNDLDIALLVCSAKSKLYKYLSPELSKTIEDYHYKHYYDPNNFLSAEINSAEIIQTLIKEAQYNQVKNSLDDKSTPLINKKHKI